jgi:SagB-type dehydrogenase family enzyme
VNLRLSSPLALTAAVLLAATPAAVGGGPDMKTSSSRQISLPKPFRHGTMSLEEALATRRSAREFQATSLTPSQLSQLLWAAQGITDRKGLRTAPSAGALYPLEIYVALPSGLHHYDPARHRLELRVDGDARPALHRAALRQPAVLKAPGVFVVTAVPARTRVKYGQRVERYVSLEAGHAAQNLLLEATALGLAGVPVGAFEDARVREALALGRGEEPLYLIPIGEPR